MTALWEKRRSPKATAKFVLKVLESIKSKELVVSDFYIRWQRGGKTYDRFCVRGACAYVLGSTISISSSPWLSGHPWRLDDYSLADDFLNLQSLVSYEQAAFLAERIQYGSENEHTSKGRKTIYKAVLEAVKKDLE